MTQRKQVRSFIFAARGDQDVDIDVSGTVERDEFRRLSVVDIESSEPLSEDELADAREKLIDVACCY